MLGAHFCNLLLVINHKQWHRQQDASEALDRFLKPPGSGQLVALLQTSDEVGEAQAHSREPLLCPTVLKEINVYITCQICINIHHENVIYKTRRLLLSHKELRENLKIFFSDAD